VFFELLAVWPVRASWIDVRIYQHHNYNSLACHTPNYSHIPLSSIIYLFWEGKGGRYRVCLYIKISVGLVIILMAKILAGTLFLLSLLAVVQLYSLEASWKLRTS
jgi:hypothetical protein